MTERWWLSAMAAGLNAEQLGWRLLRRLKVRAEIGANNLWDGRGKEGRPERWQHGAGGGTAGPGAPRSSGVPPHPQSSRMPTAHPETPGSCWRPLPMRSPPFDPPPPRTLLDPLS